jgi:hypothetical protein
VEVQALQDASKTMREPLRLKHEPVQRMEHQPQRHTAGEEGDDPSLLPSPEITARLKQKVSKGCTPEAAVEIVFAEVHGRDLGSKSQPNKDLQLEAYQV